MTLALLASASYVFNHPFFIPGVVTISSAVALGFLVGGFFI
ncbi:C4-dicarboxylate transporter dcuA [Vibrio sp. JCM 19236]|nr:C4-dicarboxylate transporter dcuA [Vibrio sp. JCM 19236]